MIEEINILDDNGTWDLEQLPVRKKDIRCGWIFAMKVNPNGSVAHLKAYVVVKGSYAQTYEWTYIDTFSQVSKMTYVQLLIPLVTTHS